jgi:hypothetical protein
MPKKLTLEQVNERLVEAGMGQYVVLEYTKRHDQSLVRHAGGKEGYTKVGSLLKGTHPSWSPECENRKDLTAEDWNVRLVEAGMGQYEVIEYAGRRGQSLVRHISGEQGCVSINQLMNGAHPSWSPECKNRRDLTAADWNTRLVEAGMGQYLVLEYAGVDGQSLVRHRSGKEGTTRLYNLGLGKHPTWSPDNQKGWNVSCDVWNRALANSGIQYQVLGRLRGTKFKVRHISGAEGSTTLTNLLKGHHPSWSPDCTKRYNIPLLEWQSRLDSAGMRYTILDLDRAVGGSLFRHISGCKGVAAVRDLVSGQHPRWSPECVHPSNENPKVLAYLCLVSEYGHKKSKVLQPHFTVGITRGTTKQRYHSGTLIETLETTPRGLNRATFEKQLLQAFRAVFGEPDTGNEAWLNPTPDRLEMARQIFKDEWATFQASVGEHPPE